MLEALIAGLKSPSLQGITGRTDLNGAIARCGVWIEKRERYQYHFFLPPYDHGPLAVAIKPSNLLIAEKLDVHDSPRIAKLASTEKAVHAKQEET